MRLYIYYGLEHENVPRNVTHVIVDDSVTTIMKEAFDGCHHLVSVIMGDHVKKIESRAFYRCRALRFIRLSKTLEHIGKGAFYNCDSLEVLFLPSTVKSIQNWAFSTCGSLRLLHLPHDINPNNIGDRIILYTAIHQIAETFGVQYEVYDGWTDRSNREVNEWLKRRMGKAKFSFHKLCCDSSVTTKYINDYLTENGNDPALAISTFRGMTPLHLLAMNPHAPADSIAALQESNMEAIFRLDRKGKNPLEYARDYNIGGLVGMINGLCSQRHAA